jgi:hydroxymethylbilane synthase
MNIREIRIGSRGSDLALWQARWVHSRLKMHYIGLTVNIVTIKTTGDKVLDAPLAKIGDKGLFTKEIENALLEREIDLAVHSLKDLPTALPEGLAIGAITEREDARDVFIPHPKNTVQTLLDQPEAAQIATGSLRRKCQLLALRPDLNVVDIRGNLSTRVAKLDGSDWAGMILAHAGIMRLGWESLVGEILDPLVMLPAVGQGALGVEIRADDHFIHGVVSVLHHEPTACAALAERALLRRLEGGCQIPIGTYGRMEGANEPALVLDAIVGSLDGRKVVKGSIRGNPPHAESLGTQLAETLLADGADEILREIRAAGANPASSVEV